MTHLMSWQNLTMMAGLEEFEAVINRDFVGDDRFVNIDLRLDTRQSAQLVLPRG